MPDEYLLYLRKSKGRAGIGRQRAVTTAHVEATGGTIIAEFTDVDRTAFQKIGEARPGRAGFDAMIAAIKAHPGARVAAWHADRLTRNDEDTRLLMAVCAAGHHLIETPRGGTYDLATATGRKRLRDDASDAIYEVDHNTERILAQKTEARAAGEWLGGRRPFGWERDPGTSEPVRLRLRFAEAGLVRQGTRDILGGASLAGVARAWNAAGVPTSGGRLWTPREAGRVLRRARNAGLVEHDGIVTGPAAWPAIVSEADWRQCVTLLEDPRRRTTPGPSPRWLLSGIAVCGVCGTPVVVNTVMGAGRVARPTYRDRPHQRRGHVGRDVAALDEYVSELVIAWVERYGQDALQPPAPDTALLAAELEAVNARLAVLEKAADDEAISEDQYVRRTRPLNQRAAGLRDRIAAAAVARVPGRVFTTGDIRAGWEAADLDAKRAIVRGLMTVTILPSPRGRPAGHKKGESYFRPETVKIGWLRGEG